MALSQGVRGADGISRRVGLIFLFCFVFQKIYRKLPSIVLTPPGRTPSQNLLVSWFLSSCHIAVKLIGIKCFIPSCLSTVVIVCYCHQLLFKLTDRGLCSRYVSFSSADKSWGISVWRCIRGFVIFRVVLLLLKKKKNTTQKVDNLSLIHRTPS